MLISKWVALRAFVDSENVLLVIFIAFGSATTMFYWTKWLSKLISQHHARRNQLDDAPLDQPFDLFGILELFADRHAFARSDQLG